MRGRESTPQVEAHSAQSLGLMACHHCGSVWRGASDGEACGHCGSTLHRRKPNSLKRTWALLIAAYLMYLPANLLPVMVTENLINTQVDTILSGIIYFWVTGAWHLAAIVFIASFLVPLFKLGALTTLVIMAQRGKHHYRPERARLYRVVEMIGRWSMLDVFVVSLMSGLVHIPGFADITAGAGIAAFAAVVVLTMLASLSFDPRLSWDGAPQPEAGDADPATATATNTAPSSSLTSLPHNPPHEPSSHPLQPTQP